MCGPGATAPTLESKSPCGRQVTGSPRPTLRLRLGGAGRGTSVPAVPWGPKPPRAFLVGTHACLGLVAGAPTALPWATCRKEAGGCRMARSGTRRITKPLEHALRQGGAGHAGHGVSAGESRHPRSGVRHDAQAARRRMAGAPCRLGPRAANDPCGLAAVWHTVPNGGRPGPPCRWNARGAPCSPARAARRSGQQ